MPRVDSFASKLINVPDFPVNGVNFKDITPILSNKDAFYNITIEFLEFISKDCKLIRVDKIIGIESRGFILASAVSVMADAGLVPIRKEGRLPRTTYKESVVLEYGTCCLEIHKDAIVPGENVIIIDDVLATGGTSEAAIKLVNSCAGNILGLYYLIELTNLKGRDKLGKHNVRSIIQQ